MKTAIHGSAMSIAMLLSLCGCSERRMQDWPQHEVVNGETREFEQDVRITVAVTSTTSDLDSARGTLAVLKNPARLVKKPKFQTPPGWTVKQQYAHISLVKSESQTGGRTIKMRRVPGGKERPEFGSSKWMTFEYRLQGKWKITAPSHGKPGDKKIGVSYPAFAKALKAVSEQSKIVPGVEFTIRTYTDQAALDRAVEERTKKPLGEMILLWGFWAFIGILLVGGLILGVLSRRDVTARLLNEESVNDTK